MAWCTLSTSTYEKVTLLLSVSLMAVYTMSFISPQWLTKDMPLLTEIHVQVTIGLFRYCKEFYSTVPDDPWLEAFSSDCSSDGADDWQKIAAGLAFTSLVLCILITLISFVLVFVKKVKGNIKLQCAQAVLQFITVGTITAILILYALDSRFELPTKAKFNADLSWGYKLSVGAAVLCAFYMLCTIGHTIMNYRQRSKVATINSRSTIDNVEMTSKPTINKKERAYMNNVSISTIEKV